MSAGMTFRLVRAAAFAVVPGVGMLAAHGLATVMTALWLARGEAALWSLLRLNPLFLSFTGRTRSAR
jgi:hypothetical protein